MRKGILSKISILLDPFVYLAQVGASKAKEWRDDFGEDLVLNYDKKGSKITKEQIKAYIDHSKEMDDMMDQLFNT